MDWQSLGGKLGKAIDIYGKTATALTSWMPWQKPLSEWNISESLESWGGAPKGSPFVWVRPAYAAEIQPTQETEITKENKQITDNKKKTGGSGQILGVSNEGWQPSQPSGPSPEELALQAARGAVESAYGPIFEYLDRMAGYLPQWKAEREALAEQLYGTQLGELETSKQSALSYFPGYRQQVKEMQGRSLKDLYQQFRNLLQAGGTYLGTMGAADSSAAGAYGALLAKSGARGVTDINRQAMEQYNQINMKQQDVVNTFNQQKSQLDTWKAGEIGKIADWYQTQQQQIEQAKATASGQRAQALASAQIELVNQALNRLNQLDQQARQWDAALREWAINRVDNLEEMKKIYPQLAQWQATPINQPNLLNASSLQTPEQQAYEWWNPYAAAKRKEEERISGWLKGLI